MLLFVLALAAAEYLIGFILEAGSPLRRSYLYMSGIDKYLKRPPKTIITDPGLVKTKESVSMRNPLETQRMFNTSDTSNIEDNSSNSMVKNNLCPVTPPDLGPVPVNRTILELDWVEKKFPEVFWGGRYSPPDCEPRHQVSIIVPYRDRLQHLPILLNHLHPFLMKQKLDYGIFVIEQTGSKAFNRGKIMNVGFVESERLRAGGWQCFVFHDVDLLPLDERNMYSCPQQPRHMSAAIDKFNYRLPYKDIFGGVVALSKEQFTHVNGYSNKYWGWGGEDNDLFCRITIKNMTKAKNEMSIERYIMLDHKKSIPYSKRYQLLAQVNTTYMKDGLSSLQYELVSVTPYHLYTHVLANVDDRS